MKNNYFKNNKGTTLLELVVSIAIFSSMVLAVASVFNNVNTGQREAIASQNIQESVRYFMEVASKEIRMAKGDFAGTGCTAGVKTFGTGGGNTELYFQNKDDECVIYKEVGGRIQVTRGADVLSVTSNDIVVSNLLFDVTDDAISTIRTLQPRVSISFEVESDSDIDMHKNTIYVQTTISSRRYE